jgi:hypothetical protein
MPDAKEFMFFTGEGNADLKGKSARRYTWAAHRRHHARRVCCALSGQQA